MVILGIIVVSSFEDTKGGPDLCNSIDIGKKNLANMLPDHHFKII